MFEMFITKPGKPGKKPKYYIEHINVSSEPGRTRLLWSRLVGAGKKKYSCHMTRVSQGGHMGAKSGICHSFEAKSHHSGCSSKLNHS